MSDLSREELAYRLRQQALLAEFGRHAIRSRDFDALLRAAIELCADGMQTSLAKVMRLLPAENRLLVVAGIGWRDGVVGHATVGADLDSPAGYAVKTGTPVISNHLTSESRFRTPQLLADHGVTRAINVIIRSEQPGDPFGVLEVDSSDRGQFDEADLSFMQGFANLLGVAIERQRSDAALAANEEQMRLIIEGATDYAIFTTEKDGTITSWCPGAEAIFGWTETEIVGQPVSLLYTAEDCATGVPVQVLAQASAKGCAEDERWHVRKSGSRFWASGSTRALHDAAGNPRGFLKIARDATERHRQQEALQDRVEHQRLLAAEVSHRVKNSLALVAGLLSMQARTTGDDAVRAALQDAENRVATIARVHDQLWRSKDIRSVDLGTFLCDLCEALQSTAPGHRIICEAVSETIAADRAIPVALIVNELVTNALKYAYPDGSAGDVHVRLVRPAEGELSVSVEDAGIGLPVGFDPTAARENLGMRVVTSLVRQLRAQLAIEQPSEGGTRFRLTFPDQG